MKIVSRFNRFKMEELLVDESIFALQNGLIGLRGNFSEGYGKNDDLKQTLINGFYNHYDYNYEENSPAFPQKGERIVNIIDGQTVNFFIHEKPINLTECNLKSLERHFDLDKGSTIRRCHYVTPDGKEFLVEEEKLVSFVQKELALIKISLTSINYNGDVAMVSSLKQPNLPKSKTFDPRINQATKKELVIEDKITNDSGVCIIAKTTNSNLYLGVGMAHEESVNYRIVDDGIEAFDNFTLSPNQTYSITKHLVYTPNIIYQDVLRTNQDILEASLKKGFDYYKNTQIDYLKKFWNSFTLEIIGNDNLDLMLQYNIYQLNASSINDSRFNIPAKGLSGEGYEGHYFWDTEIYMIPFFTINNPEIAKSLLMFRYYHFPEARNEAIKQGSPIGVKIPWRTINGNELSPYYPAGSAQYHINSDLAYSVIKYYEFTNDFDFMRNYGFEMLLETGRFLYFFGSYAEGDFHINGVTGPDEYTTVVNDNYYTNSMAKYHFEKIVDFYKKNKEQLSLIIKKLNVTDEEIEKFAEAAEKMHFSFNKEKGIYAQDHSFLRKKDLDLNTIPKDNFPLLLNYHPLFIYKHQVLKQADVLLSMFLLDFEDTKVFNNNFDYYFPRTSHDSSLSKCIHSIVAFRLNRPELAYEYFLDVLKIDYDNTHKNTNQGLHIANSGGTYLTILYGILGFRIHDSRILIRPLLPKELKGIKIGFDYQGNKITFVLDKQINIYVSKPIKLGIYKDTVSVETEYHCDYKQID